MTDARDKNLDGMDDLDTLEAQADANRPYGEVTAEDLSDVDLIGDGGDLAATLGPDDPDLEGVIPLDHEIELDRDSEETIDDRIRQEEYDPASSIVPPDAGA